MVQMSIFAKAKQKNDTIPSKQDLELGNPDVLSSDSLPASCSYYHDAKNVFEKTFSGFYKEQVKEMKAKYGSPPLRETISDYTMNLVRFLFIPGYMPGYGRYMELHDYRNSFYIIFLSIILGVLSIIGLVSSSHKVVYLMPLYLFHLAFFWIMMSESRRALPIVPFFVLFGILGILQVLKMGFPQWKFSIFRDESREAGGQNS